MTPLSQERHCERSEAIQNLSADTFLDCFAALAMTEQVATPRLSNSRDSQARWRILAAHFARA
ncbi:hypothetical protein, partial [Bradyrhizobium yuanmingense]|uniref:hypothetical protein n=1 Tax=Bradyrhizobium yuanmingense TaxID=108015 RepID=UPI001AEBFA87